MKIEHFLKISRFFENGSFFENGPFFKMGCFFENGSFFCLLVPTSPDDSVPVMDLHSDQRFVDQRHPVWGTCALILILTAYRKRSGFHQFLL